MVQTIFIGHIIIWIYLRLFVCIVLEEMHTNKFTILFYLVCSFIGQGFFLANYYSLGSKLL
jgi:hypothetical protein